MNCNYIPYYVGLIDSLTIYLPLDKIEVIDLLLTDEFRIYYPKTGLYLEDDYPPKPIIIDCDGIKFRYNKVVWPPNKNNPLPQSYIRVTLTSKMLFERYFDGINHSNISSIVDYINSTNVIKIDLETALNSLCNDIDICMNYQLLYQNYQDGMFELKRMVKDSKKHLVEIFPRKQENMLGKNFGLMFGTRDSGCIGSPFIKFYNKEEELLKHSVDFYNRYIFPQCKYGLSIKNLIRKEVTLKNTAVKQNLLKKRLVHPDNKMKTLNDILDITQTELTTICNVQIKYYFEKKIIYINEHLSPTDKLISFYMLSLVNQGFDKSRVITEALVVCFPDKKDKVQKSVTNKKLLRIYDITFKSNYMADKLSSNSITNQFLKMLEIW